ALAIVAIASPLAAFYGEPGVAHVLHILVFTFLLTPLNAIGIALLRRELEFGATFRLEVFSNFVWASVAVALTFLGSGYLSMAWASFAGTLAMGVLILATRSRMMLIRPSLSQWRRVVGFGSFVTLTSLIGQLGMLSPALILGRIGGFSDVAFYNRGNS